MIHSKSALIIVALAGGGAAGVFAQPPYCTGKYEGSDAVCKQPGDIDPTGGTGCTELPDCPYWCDPESTIQEVLDYCTATKIDGATVPKYRTEFFVPPVIADRRFNRKSIAVREFLQQILPNSTQAAPDHPGFK